MSLNFYTLTSKGCLLYTKKWVKSFLQASLVIIFSVSAINYTINPYNVFGHELDQLFSKKNNVLSDRMSKFYAVNRLNPKTIMMGTSRIGVLPSSQLDPYLEGPIYNLSMAGSTIDEQAAYIRYMVSHHKIKNVVWSLDFFAFNPTKPIDPTFDPDRLTKDFYGNDYFISLFSFKTLYRSFKTLKNNLYEDNQKDDTKGQPFTRQQVVFNIHYTLDEYKTEKTFLFSEPFKIPSSIDPKIDIVRQTLELCREHNVSCFLYTSPVYHQHIDMIYSIGLGKTFESWKKSLADIQPYTDFCTYSTLSNEMMMFRDSSHVISDVGEVIFARIFNLQKNIHPTDFGFTVTPQNIDQHLEQERKLRHDISI